MQAPQLRAGLDADLAHERVAREAVGLERVGLAPRAVEREHALRVQLLAQRLTRRRAPRARRRPRDGGPASRSASIACSSAARRSSSSRRISAAANGSAETSSSAGPAPLRQRLARHPARDQTLEPPDVDVLVADAQLVAVPAGDDDRRRSRRGPCAAGRRGAGRACCAVAGGSSPHSPSISRSDETTVPARSASRARSARGLPAPIATGRPSTVASTGPKSRTSMTASGRPYSRAERRSTAFYRDLPALTPPLYRRGAGMPLDRSHPAAGADGRSHHDHHPHHPPARHRPHRRRAGHRRRRARRVRDARLPAGPAVPGHARRAAQSVQQSTQDLRSPDARDAASAPRSRAPRRRTCARPTRATSPRATRPSYTPEPVDGRRRRPTTASTGSRPRSAPPRSAGCSCCSEPASAPAGIRTARAPRASDTTSDRSARALTCDYMVTYCREHGRGVQGAGGPDAEELARRALPRGRAVAQRIGGAAAHDALRRHEAPEDPRGGGPRDHQEARSREAPLPEPRPDPARPRPVGEQIRRALGRRPDRAQADSWRTGRWKRSSRSTSRRRRSKLWEAITNPELRRQYNFGVGVESDWAQGSALHERPPRRRRSRSPRARTSRSTRRGGSCRR